MADDKKFGAELPLNVVERICPTSAVHYSDKPHPNIHFRLLAGLNADNFDRESNPRIPSLMWLDQMAKLIAMLRPHDTRNGQPVTNASGDTPTFFQDYSRIINQGHMGFGYMIEFEFTRALYNLDLPKRELNFRMTMGNVGRYDVSAISEGYVSDGVDGAEIERQPKLWTSRVRGVFVGQKTRQIAAVPDWFREKNTGKGCLEKPVTLPTYQRPEKTFVHRITVQWSDTDQYLHAKFASYIFWTLNAIRAAFNPNNTKSSGKELLGALSTDMMARGVSKVNVIFIKECMEGDEVDVHLWQEGGASAEEAGLVWACLVKDNKDICLVKVWYFES